MKAPTRTPTTRSRPAASARLGALLLALLLTAPVIGAAAPAADAAAVVRTTAERVLDAVRRHRDAGHEDTAPLAREVDALLAEHVDFDAISRAVMGTHAPAATPGERRRFATVFRTTLVRLYADALVAFEARSLEVRDAEPLGADRARVPMTVLTPGGRRFVVHYALVRDTRGWQVRNLVVDGINLGLTFRNQFAALMGTHGGNVTAVIDTWSGETARAHAAAGG